MTQYEIESVQIKKEKIEMYYGDPTAPKPMWEIRSDGERKLYEIDGSLDLTGVMNTFANDGWIIVNYSEDKKSYKLILEREKKVNAT